MSGIKLVSNRTVEGFNSEAKVLGEEGWEIEYTGVTVTVVSSSPLTMFFSAIFVKRVDQTPVGINDAHREARSKPTPFDEKIVVQTKQIKNEKTGTGRENAISDLQKTVAEREKWRFMVMENPDVSKALEESEALEE